MRTAAGTSGFGRFVVACAIIIGTGAGCGTSSSPSGPSGSTSYDGTWRGPGLSGGSNVNNIGVISTEFVVASGSITKFTLSFRFVPGTAGCTFTATTASALTNTTFSYTFANGGVTTTVTGTFTSATQGTGTVGRIDFANISCGGTITGFASGDSITFTKV
jgi:hypothetical protein